MAKIEHRTLNDRTYDQIKKGLISGAFRSGQTLVIRTLAEAYGISATPVREALQRLVAERHLDLLPNRSIVVPQLSVERFVELSRIRRELEGLAGELATNNFKPSAIRRLGTLVEAMDAALDSNNGRYQDLNQKFHFAIYECSGSPVLSTMIQNMWSQVGPFFNELTDDLSYVGKANEQHKAILAAIRSGDAAAARRCLALDITVASDHLVAWMQRPDGAGAATDHADAPRA